LIEDIPFYRDLAVAAKGPCLELGCGTARVLIPVAQAGVEVVGVDVSPAMLKVAREKVKGLSPRVRRRIKLVEADMRDFDLGDERFNLIYIPFRAFLHLLTTEDQLQALATIRRHLRPGGRLALNFFNPRLEIIASRMATRDATPFLERTTDLFGGERLIQWAWTRYYPLTQRVENEFMYDRVAADGKMIERVYRRLVARWVYRFEAEHLFTRAGFTIEALYGDFEGRPFERDTDEQVWVLKKTEDA
jgi:ubiquinone/menaquinone biosynthesis C-methylase UbiE